MPQLFRNNAFSALGASLTNVATTLTVTTGHGDRFPAVTAPDFFMLTLQNASNNIEIVRVTARTAGADSMTIQRAQEGTTARAWNIDDVVELRLTAFALNPLSLLEGSATAAAVRAILDVPTRAGGDASGTWNIAISGNAATATTTTGNAGTATTLQTARNINGVSFNGSADITLPTVNTTGDQSVGGVKTFSSQIVASGGVQGNVTGNAGTVTNGVYTTGDQTIAGVKTFSSQIVASGGVQGNVTGNATTATALQTARTINGVSFNGTADITTNSWGTARTVTIGSTGKSVDGSANVSWSLAEIGAQAALGFTPANATQLTAGVTQTNFDAIKSPGLYQYDGTMTATPNGSANYRSIEIGSNGRYSQIALPWDHDGIWFRRQQDTTWGTWREVLHAGNFTSYSPSLTGSGASGTWGINVTGNAATVTNGVYTTGDQTIGGRKTFTGMIHLTGDPAPVGTAGSTGILEVGDPSGNTPATMSFHKQGYAINMGLDTDNVFRLGGWSQGANSFRWTSDTAGNFVALGNITANGQFIGNGSVPPGAVVHFAMNSVPTGWLRANGAAVSRTTFAALFNAIGTTYGTGDGSTTFNLPDLRGEFLRGWDDGRGVDSGRAFGSAQGHQMQSHNHTIASGSGSNGSFSGVLQASTFASGTSSTTHIASAGGTSNGSENRPRNIAMLACIKF